jgi:hypothetical protein
MSDPAELQRCCALLGVTPEVTPHELERAWMRKSFALIKDRESDRARELKAAYAVVLAHAQAAGNDRPPRRSREEMEEAAAEAELEELMERNRLPAWDPRSLESPWIMALAPPLVVALAWSVQSTSFKFLLQGFHIWIHEFGHATVAWMSGYRALPLPFGWTNIETVKSDFVYYGVLFLLGVFAWTGWKERRFWPILIAPPIALAQAWMTWQVPEWRTEQWITFGGVGGEFYLSAAMVAAFFFNLPEKFRWGACRYVFLFLGASCFIHAWTMWRDIAAGVEDIPWGTMIHGEDDQGGDMNKLHGGWGWPRERIITSYNNLATACVIAVGMVYLFFNLRLNRLPVWLIDRMRGV